MLILCYILYFVFILQVMLHILLNVKVVKNLVVVEQVLDLMVLYLH